MFNLLQKLPFLLEFFFNGAYISLFSSRKWWPDWIYSYVSPDILDIVLEWASWLVPLVILFTLVVNYTNSKRIDDFFRNHIFSIIVFFPMIITLGDEQFTFWLATSHLLASILSIYETDDQQHTSGEISPVKKYKNADTSFLSAWGLKPAQLVLLTFFGIILGGTLLLMLPWASKSGNSISFVDALFTSTSATCVTGLSTLSLSDSFTLFGQLVVLALIQIGGLGYMTLYSISAILLGRSMGMKDRVVMQDLLDVSSLEDLISLIVDIIKYTFIIELWGGIVLTIAFTFLDYDFSKAIYFGFFHSISAFCNAGFSLFDTSLESFATNPLIHGTISVLIILGGLGFIVLRELRSAIVEKKSFVRFGMHTKIVLITTFALIGSGTLFIFFGEFLHSLDGYSLWEKIQVSTFQSVTLRTAGFNTIPLTSLNKFTIYIMTIFMFIGAAPGSTGGGIKITTFAILLQSIKSTLKGRESVELFDRRIPQTLVVRVTALTIISIGITSFFIFVMMKLEPQEDFLTIFFEVISASGTVGLSLGLTPFLSVMGKCAIALLMFVGRTGPLTLVLALGQRNQMEGRFQYPKGRVMIG